MTARILKELARKPQAAGLVSGTLYRYRHIRHMYDKGVSGTEQRTGETYEAALVVDFCSDF